MSSAILRRASLFLLSGLAFAVLATAMAEAAEPAVYRLAEATHVGRLTVAKDGTAWFVPSRGTLWDGSDSIISSVTPDGEVAEHEVAGFGNIARVAVGPAGDLWIAGYLGEYTKNWLLQLGHLSASGELEKVYTVGRGGEIQSLVIADASVWVVGGGTLKRVSLEGAVQRVPFPKGCYPSEIVAGTRGALWLTDSCRAESGRGRSRQTYVDEIDETGRIVRHRLVAGDDEPISITTAPDGTVWFDVSYSARDGSERAKIGRITAKGDLAEYAVPNALPYHSIAVGPGDRLWFESSFGGFHYRALNSIGVDGRIGKPICAQPGCYLEPTGVVRAPDGSLWYGLEQPNTNMGGGGAGLELGIQRANEAGSIAHLAP